MTDPFFETQLADHRTWVWTLGQAGAQSIEEDINLSSLKLHKAILTDAQIPGGNFEQELREIALAAQMSPRLILQGLISVE